MQGNIDKSAWFSCNPIQAHTSLLMPEAAPAASLRLVAFAMQESLQIVRALSDPTAAPSWRAFADMAASWSSRWPSAQQGSSAAALTVINTRDILLQSVAAEFAKGAQVQHKVWVRDYSGLCA